MSIQGKQKEPQKDFAKELFVGLTSGSIVAVNPTKKKLNELFGREDKDDDKEIDYVSTDNDGNKRVRLSFWLKDEVKGKFFPYSFNLTKKERKNKDGDKVQIINATCGTSWVPLVEGTEDANEELIPEWFKNFTNRDKEVLGKKKWRKALVGEEELGILMRAWLGRMNFMDADTEVFVDTEKLFNGKFDELQSLINGDYDSPFTFILGVKTDVDDATKKYQQIWGKQFLPNGFLTYIKNGMKFPSDYSKKIWNKFENEISGEYGFDSFHKLSLIEEYNEADDLAASANTKAPEPSSSDY